MEDIESWRSHALTVTNGLREFHSATPLEWSEECFEAAKKQANECQKKKESFRGNMEGASGRHGQNLLYSADVIEEFPQLDDVVDEWYTVSDDYCFMEPGPQDGSENLTQLLWASTKVIGIATSEDGHYIVANFFPAGNVEGEYEENIGLPEYIVEEDVDKLGMKFGALPPKKLIVREVYDDDTKGHWAKQEGVNEGDRFVAINQELVSEMTDTRFAELIKVRPLYLRLFVGLDPPDAMGPSLSQKPDLKDAASKDGKGTGKLQLVADESVKSLGLTVSKEKPMEVRRVAPDSWAENEGIEAGYIFMEINKLTASEMTYDKFMDLVKNHRPLTFRLPSPEERAATLKLQAAARGHVARKTKKSLERASKGESLSTADWRLARSRLAKLEIAKDQKAKEKDGATMRIERADMIKVVFKNLDMHFHNVTNTIESEELYLFASVLDFPAKSEWAAEFYALFTDYEWKEKDHISLEEFTDLVNDEQSNPYYCGSDTLSLVLQTVEKAHKEEAAKKLQSVCRGRQAIKRAK
jgi:hypothetical protein